MCRLFSKNPQTFQALRSDKMPSNRRLSLLMQGRLSNSADSTVSGVFLILLLPTNLTGGAQEKPNSNTEASSLSP